MSFLLWPVFGGLQSVTFSQNFDRFLESRDWDGLLWLEFGKEHRDELTRFLKALLKDEEEISNWLDWEEDGTKTPTLSQVVKRFLELLDVVLLSMDQISIRDAGESIDKALRLFEGGETPPHTSNDPLILMTETLCRLQRVLLLGECLEELEIFREGILSRMVLPLNNNEAELGNRIFSISLLVVCLSFTEEDIDPELFECVAHMVDKDQTHRDIFIERCKREIETVVRVLEIAQGGLLKVGVISPFIHSGIRTMTSILTASRLEFPFRINQTVTKPIPSKLATHSEDWFKRLLAVCLSCDAFVDFEILAYNLGIAMMYLPEFWVVSDALPLFRLLALIWKMLGDSLIDAEKALLQMSIALRNLVSPLRADNSALVKVETRLARIIKAETIPGSLPQNARYPAVTFLLGCVTEQAIPGKNQITLDTRRLLLQTLMLIAEGSTLGDSLLMETMGFNDCSVLRDLLYWMSGDAKVCLDIIKACRARRLDGAELARLAQVSHEICATLNVMESLLQHKGVRDQFVSALKLTKAKAWSEFVNELESVHAAARWIHTKCLQNKKFVRCLERQETKYDLGLTINSTNYCLLSILENLIIKVAPMADLVETRTLQMLLDEAAESSLPSEERALAVVSLARAVEYSNVKWKWLQALRSSTGLRLSDVCAREDLTETQNGLESLLEALTIFQYMADKKDADDGNRTVLDGFDFTPLGPIVHCLLETREALQQDEPMPSDLHIAGLCFELVGNYAGNVGHGEARSHTSERELVALQAFLLIGVYLQLPADVLRANLEAAEACLFALSNLLVVRDSTVMVHQVLKASVMVDHVLKAASWLTAMIKNDEGNEQSVLDRLIPLACKSIINSSAMIRGQHDVTQDLIVFLLAALKRLRLCKSWIRDSEGAMSALLALHNLMRNSPETKAAVYELGGKEELEAWYSEVQKENGPLKDCLVVAMQTFGRNNPRMDSTISWLDGVKQPRALQEVVVASGLSP